MGFDLHIRPAPAGLADLGTLVELREVPYGRMRELMSGPGPLSGPERLLAEVLHIDGQPLGIDRLQNSLPSRYTRAVRDSLALILKMHDIDDRPEKPEAPGDQADDQAAGPEGGNA
jgi:hypothetical protein